MSQSKPLEETPVFMYAIETGGTRMYFSTKEEAQREASIRGVDKIIVIHAT